MFQDDPVFALLNFAIAAYLFYMWYGDFTAFRRSGVLPKKALAGAATVSPSYVVCGILAAVALLAVHTATEFALGVEASQTRVAWWAIFSWIGAAFVEELIFRGYLVVQNRGRGALIASIIAFSLIFALGHPFMWDYTVPEGASVFGGVWKFDFSVQPVISTLAIFECSVLFYALRFLPKNKNASIIPCFAAHAAYNIGVFAVKAANGFIDF